MERRIKIILISLSAVLLVALGLVIFAQQRTINTLKKIVSPAGSADQSAPTPEKPRLAADLAEKTKIQLVDNTQEINGKITKISGSILTVEADVVDIGKIVEAESADKLPMTKKTYTVRTDGKTDFVNLKIESLSVGQSIKVFAVELVYQTDNLTAIRVIPSNENSSADIKAAKTVVGKIEKLTGSSLLFKSSNPQEKDKEYTAVVGDSTKLTKTAAISDQNQKPAVTTIKLSDIKEGDMVSVSLGKASQGNSEFEALSVTVLSPPPATPPQKK